MRYKCSKCGQTDETNMHDLIEVGEPHCADCGLDMEAVEFLNTENPQLKATLPDVRNAYGDEYYDNLSTEKQLEIDEKINALEMRAYLDKFLQYNGVHGFTNDIMSIIEGFQ